MQAIEIPRQIVKEDTQTMMVNLDDTSNVFVGTSGDDNVNGGLGDDELRGGAGNDTLTGGGNNDKLFGGAGNDLLFSNGFIELNQGEGQLFGGAGDDTLVGENVNDVLVGGRGDDLIVGAGGSNTATGGAGADEYAFTINAFSIIDPEIPSVDPETTTITDFNLNQDSIISQTENNQFSELRFSGSSILSASTGRVVFTLEGVDTSDLTESNFIGFQGDFSDVVV